MTFIESDVRTNQISGDSPDRLAGNTKAAVSREHLLSANESRRSLICVIGR